MGTATETLRRTGITRFMWLRKAAVLRNYGCRPRDHLGYLLFDPELSNFTYDIENRNELRAWLDRHLGEGTGSSISELDNDEALRGELDQALRWRPDATAVHHFGRRLGWYAIVRRTKPSLVVETGTHNGLGSCAILAALDRNAQEGNEGRLVSIDPRKGTGWLVSGRLRRRWKSVRATSYDALPDQLDGAMPNVFIHDSLHTRECETWELRTAASLGASVLISDNSHASPVLQEVARESGASYAYFQERPRHWYPGGGIGLALRPSQRTSRRQASD